jgi:cobalamin-dependent methionine synthase I
VWFDPVLLPWVDDVAAGAPVLEYLREASARWPGLKCLVGLSNVSYRAPHRRRLHREWLVRLRDAGLQGVILDPLDPVVLAVARG